MTHQQSFEEDPWPRQEAQAIEVHNALLLKLDSYEGPIDVLLSLARDQKVDLTKISILALARQYLSFIDEAKKIRLELAADYLVMAAWLAYLKSKLLLPKIEDEEGELSGPEMVEALAFQLRRLEAMQKSAETLFNRPQLGQHVFKRGMPEGLKLDTDIQWDASIYDLLKSYGDLARRADPQTYEVKPFNLVSMEEAMNRLTTMLGDLPCKGKHSVWTTLQSFMPEKITDVLTARSAIASTLTAGLELAKQGKADLRQDGVYKPIYIRGKEEVNDNA